LDNDLNLDDQNEEGEEGQLDLDNLNEQEKVVVWHYFREEYEKDPYSLPIAKETVE